MPRSIETRLARLEEAIESEFGDLAGLSMEEIRELEYRYGMRCPDCDCELPSIIYGLGQGRPYGPGLKLDYHKSWLQLDVEEMTAGLERAGGTVR